MKKSKRIVTRKGQKTVDGFQNFAARLGIGPGRGDAGTEDNLLSKGHYEFNLVTRNRIQLEAAYRGSWIVGRVVDSIPKDMVRAGIEITTSEDAERVNDLQLMMKRYKIFPSLCSGLRWGRLYGGTISVPQIRGQKLDEPLDISKVKKGDFLGLATYDRWQLYPTMSETIDDGPDIGLPAYYDVVLGSNVNDPGKEPGFVEHNENATGRVRIHHSRCSRFIGHELPFFQSITEMMWGESILERMWDRLIAFDDATMNCGNLIHRAQLRVVGINGLREILAAGGEAQQALIEQFEYIRQFQQNEGITLLDKDDLFDSVAYSFAGLSDMLIQFSQQVAGAAETPLVVLFEQSPAGLNASGESDLRLYYDSILAKQEADLRNPLTILMKIMWRSMTGDESPSDLGFNFNPLWQSSETEKATVAKTITDTIIEAHDAGGISDATMMKELKHASTETGIFTHITDEDIASANEDIEEPPQPDIDIDGGSPAGDPGESSAAGPKEWGNKSGEKTKPKSKDAAFVAGEFMGKAYQRIKKFLSKDAGKFKEDEHPRKDNGEFGSGGGGGSSESKKESQSGNKEETKKDYKSSETVHSFKVDATGGHGQKYVEEYKFLGNGQIMVRGIFPDEGITDKWVKFKKLKSIENIKEVAEKFEKHKKEQYKSKDAPVNDPGVAGTMKEFYKGTLKSSSGEKVTSKKQAAAIGYSEEGEKKSKDENVEVSDDRKKIMDFLGRDCP